MMASEMKQLQDTLDALRKERDEYKVHLDEQLELNNQLLVEVGELSNDLQANMDEMQRLRQQQAATPTSVAMPASPSLSPWPSPSTPTCAATPAPAPVPVPVPVPAGQADVEHDPATRVRALEVKLAAATADFETLQADADRQITGPRALRLARHGGRRERGCPGVISATRACLLESLT